MSVKTYLLTYLSDKHELVFTKLNGRRAQNLISKIWYITSWIQTFEWSL